VATTRDVDARVAAGLHFRQERFIMRPAALYVSRAIVSTRRNMLFCPVACWSAPEHPETMNLKQLGGSIL
jgi:hypothetical protein